MVFLTTDFTAVIAISSAVHTVFCRLLRFEANWYDSMVIEDSGDNLKVKVIGN